MKKTLKDQNKALELALKNSENTVNCLASGLGLFALTTAILGIVVLGQDRDNSRLEHKLRYKNQVIERFEFKDKCTELKVISGQDFYVFNNSYCNSNTIILDSIQQIEDAIRHYQLGSKK